MPVNPNAMIEVTAFDWVPDVARGIVRDLRVRWALEEAGLDYRVRLLDAMTERPEDYFLEQPFGQVPVFTEGAVRMFETGAILLHLGERSEGLLPRDEVGRARALCWVVAALNSVEPAIMSLTAIDLFYAEEEWAKLRRPGAVDFARLKLKRVSDWLGERDWLEDRFTVGDLIMTTVVRNLRHTELIQEFPNLVAWQKRCEARPAFERALAAQIADFKELEAA